MCRSPWKSLLLFGIKWCTRLTWNGYTIMCLHASKYPRFCSEQTQTHALGWNASTRTYLRYVGYKFITYSTQLQHLVCSFSNDLCIISDKTRPTADIHSNFSIFLSGLLLCGRISNVIIYLHIFEIFNFKIIQYSTLCTTLDVDCIGMRDQTFINICRLWKTLYLW